MKCHACNKGTLHQKIKSQVFTYKGKSIKLDQPGLWCNSCEKGILDGDDIIKTEKTFEAFKNKIDSLLNPENQI